jgi:hypothetical protein
MDVEDVGVAILAFLPLQSVSVKREGGRMTTELYEVYSIEKGDQVVIGEEIYKILEILDGTDTDYIIRLADEEGNVKKVCANSHQKFSVVIDNLTEV